MPRAPLSLVAAIATGALILALPAPAELPLLGQRAGALLAVAIVLWVTGARAGRPRQL
jgi:hypothetical protein